jgi:hypothetical protein
MVLGQFWAGTGPGENENILEITMIIFIQSILK